MPKVDFAEVKKTLTAKIKREPSELDVQSYLMYPQVFLDYEKFTVQYGNVSPIPTPAFFYGLQTGEEISVEIEEGKNAHHPLPYRGRGARRWYPHRLLRAERPARAR